MAEGKKGFILYADQKELFDQLSDHKAGILIKHIFKYVNDENPISKDMIINLAFTPIKQQLKRDLKHWENIRIERSKAGKASAEARKKKKQNLTNPTNVDLVQQNLTNPTVIVNDNVKVKVNVKDTINGFDFDYKTELLNYIKHLQENHNRDIGYMQVEQMIKMLDSWYQEKQDKINCLSMNISSDWKTLNFVEQKNKTNKIDGFKFPEQWKIKQMSVTEYQDMKKEAREDGWKITQVQTTGQTSFEKDGKQIII